MRKCKKCGAEYPLEHYKKHRNRNGRVWTCRLCLNIAQKEWARNNRDKVFASRIKSYYNITIEQYNELKANGCMACGTMEKLHIDHNHACCAGGRSCGKCVRGVLCNRHNTALGMVNDSIEELESLIKYLASRA